MVRSIKARGNRTVDFKVRKSSKLKLKRDGVDWRRWTVVPLVVAVVLVPVTLNVLPVGSEAGSTRVKNLVGTDLALEETFRSGGNSPSSREGSQSISRSQEFPVMTRYQISTITPRQPRSVQLPQSDHLEFIKYTVKKGDNIWKIARRYDLKTYSIVSSNYDTLTGRNYLPAGEELRIPNRNGVLTKLKQNQTLWDLSKTYGTQLETVLKFNEIKSPSQITPGTEIFIPEATPVNPYKFQLFQGGDKKFLWPVSPGRRNVSSKFGSRQHPILNRDILHRGIDIAAKFGTGVFASRSGIVESVRQNDGYGQMVKISHTNSYTTVYAHLSNDFVKEGQYVQRGQRIGEIGKSGLATGSNLHFELRKNGKVLDPLKFL